MTLTVDFDLNGASPQFTLTCISTGGPATTVTWTRDSVTITEGTETVLNNATTAQYTHTLYVTGRLGGLYTCAVSNDKPSSDSSAIFVEGITSLMYSYRHCCQHIISPSVADAPTNLRAVVHDNLTSVSLTWDPPILFGYTSGYRIDYTNNRDSGSRYIHGSLTNEYALYGLESGTKYNISIVGTSSHFFSETITITVELIEQGMYGIQFSN